MTWSRDQVIVEMSNFDVSDEAGQLVFADWLEENGQDGWAGVVRLFTPTSLSTKWAEYKFFKVFPEWIRLVRGFKPGA